MGVECWLLEHFPRLSTPLERCCCSLALLRRSVASSSARRYARESALCRLSAVSPSRLTGSSFACEQHRCPRRRVIITHIFWSISVNRGDKAFRMVAFVHKLCPVIPLHKRPQKDMGNDDSRVGVGMLASPMVGYPSPRVARCKHLLPYPLSPPHCIPQGLPKGSPPPSPPPP